MHPFVRMRHLTTQKTNIEMNKSQEKDDEMTTSTAQNSEEMEKKEKTANRKMFKGYVRVVRRKHEKCPLHTSHKTKHNQHIG